MRGLESLIPPRKLPQESGNSKESIFLIEIDNISPNSEQPRTEFNEDELKGLASSIRTYGILQPLLVRKIEEDVPSGRKVSYELIAGERRLRASKLVGLSHVPAIIRGVRPQEKLELSLVENLQRNNLNPIEEALAYQRLQDEYNFSQQEIADRMGKSRPVVANALRMLRLPRAIQDAVREGKISFGHTRPLLSLENPDLQLTMFQEIIEKNLPVHAVEDKVREMLAPLGKASKRAQADPQLKELEHKIKTALVSSRVALRADNDKARLAITFPSREELVQWAEKWLGSTGT